MFTTVAQAHSLKVFARQAEPFLARNLLVVKGQGDVLCRSLESEKVEGLEYEANKTVAVLGRFALGKVSDKGVFEVIGTFIVIVENPEDIEEGGFA